MDQQISFSRSRSKSSGITTTTTTTTTGNTTPYRSSIRRKVSFQKVRQQFESHHNNNNSVVNITVNLSDIKRKTLLLSSVNNNNFKPIGDPIGDPILEVINESNINTTTTTTTTTTTSNKLSHISSSIRQPDLLLCSSTASVLPQIVDHYSSPAHPSSSVIVTTTKTTTATKDLSSIRNKISFFEDKSQSPSNELFKKQFIRKTNETTVETTNRKQQLVDENTTTGNNNSQAIVVNTINVDSCQLIDHTVVDPKCLVRSLNTDIIDCCHQLDDDNNKNSNTNCDNDNQNQLPTDGYVSDCCTDSVIDIHQSSDNLIATTDSQSPLHIVFRRADSKHLISNKNDIINDRPVPKQRTLIGRKDERIKRVCQKDFTDFFNNNNSHQLINEESLSKNGNLKPDVKRSSSLSQDSGIVDSFTTNTSSNNSSFLHQTNCSNNLITDCQTNRTNDSSIDGNHEKQLDGDDDDGGGDDGNDDMSIYDDHIYEELGHYQSSRQSRTSNDWIDIETNDQQKIRIEVILNRRSHLKANNNYKSRLSFKPKTNQIHNNNNNNNKRRSSRRPSMINVVYSDGSDSATEYEDIDDDDDDHNNEKISIKQHMSSEISDKSMVSLVSLNKNNDESQLRPISSDQRLSDHIYEEAMIDNNILMVNNDRKSCTDLQNKLVRELSLRLLDSKTTITTSTTIDGNKTIDECDKTTTTTTTTGNELYNDIRLETSCEPNIYTATPRRLPNQMMTKTDPTITSRLDSKTAIAVSKSIDAINSEIREKFNDKRLTIASNRNSSIYISPNYSQANDDNDNTNTNNNNFIINRRNQNNQYKLKPINSLNQFNQIPSPSSSPSPTTMSPTMRSELIQKHTSMVASIASYLEFDNNLIDYCPSGVGGDDDNSISSSSSSSNNWNWSPLSSEPLYQFYQKDVRRRAELWKSFEPNSHTSQSDYDEYEIYSSSTAYDTGDGCTGGGWSGRSGGNGGSGKNEPIKSMLLKRNISAMDFVGNGPNRTLWCHLPQVINSSDNLLSRLSDQEKRLQEAMFEIISSEASYYKSINILVKHFHNCLEFSGNSYQQILNPIEKKSLFSNILDISKTSCQLLAELEKRFQQNVLLYDICDILCDYAVNHFQPYIHYCAYQRDQEKLLTQLTQSRPQFLDVLQRLESNQICQNQALLSFLMLPMQRITRYPLLIDAVCQQLPETSPLLPTAQKSLGIMNQLVRKCNDETKKVQRMQELMETVKILHFNRKVKSCPIVKGTRYLVKKGSVTRLSPQLSAKKTIGKSSTLKWSKNTIYLYLFSDLLILAKKKSENYYSVFDYCNRDTVQLISLAANDGGAGGGGGGEGVPLGRDVQAFRLAIPPNYLNPAQLILLKNHQDKIAEYTINFNLESEKLRWIEAVSQPSSDNPNEVIYEEWDCPQVQCILSYSAQQTDEISLEETDVLNVFRKMNDGWFEGERLRDGLRGWFPSKYTEAIINQHVKARNMKLRHRLLMYTQSVIDEQKRMSFTS